MACVKREDVVCGHLKRIVESLKKIQQVANEDNVYYSKARRRTTLGAIGGLTTVAGIGLFFPPAAMFFAVSGGVAAVTGASAIAYKVSCTAEQAAHRKYAEIAEADLNEFESYLKKNKKRFQDHYLVVKTIVVMEHMIEMNTFVVIINGDKLIGEAAIQSLKEAARLSDVGWFEVIGINFSVTKFAEDGATVNVHGKSKFSRELGAIICTLEEEISDF